jgi:hypothetical protein
MQEDGNAVDLLPDQQNASPFESKDLQYRVDSQLLLAEQFVC